MKLLYCATIASIFAFPVLAQQSCLEVKDAFDALNDAGYSLSSMDISGTPEIFLFIHPSGKWRMTYANNLDLCLIAQGNKLESIPYPNVDTNA